MEIKVLSWKVIGFKVHCTKCIQQLLLLLLLLLFFDEIKTQRKIRGSQNGPSLQFLKITSQI